MTATAGATPESPASERGRRDGAARWLGIGVLPGISLAGRPLPVAAEEQSFGDVDLRSKTQLRHRLRNATDARRLQNVVCSFVDLTLSPSSSAIWTRS